MRRIAVVAAVAFLHFGFGAQAQEPSQEEVQQFLEFLAEGFADMKPSPGPVLDVPDEEPLAPDVTAAGIREGLALYQRSFSFSVDERAATLDIESEPALVPGSRFVTARLGWREAPSAGKKGAPEREAATPATELEPLASLAHARLPLPSQAKPGAKHLDAELTVRYPARIATVELGAREVGQDRPLGKAMCRLRSIENDVATVDCTGAVDGIQVLPLSGQGVVLDTSSSMSGPTAIYRELKKSGKPSRALIAKVLANPDDLGKEGSTRLLKAKGKIARLLVLLPVEHQTETLPVQAFPLPDFGGKTCPAIPAPHFAPPGPPEAFARVSEAQVKQGTAIVAGRSEAMIGYNNQVIHIVLPSIPNSRLATLEVKDLVLKRRGAKVAFEPQGPFPDDKRGGRYSFRMEPPRGDEPVVYDSASGKAVLHYPVQVVTRRVAAPGQPGVAKIEGCQVRRYTDSGHLDLTSGRPPLRAYDQKGRLLQMIRNYSTGGIDDVGAYAGVRFWGSVAWVEVDEVKEWKDITIPFSLRPAPLLPKQSP
jgi:hypothetical protein